MKNIEISLFNRVVSILDQSRAKVWRAINSGTVTAYWLIGREIVLEIQNGEQRAGYGNKVIEDLSIQLNKKFGKGFSKTNLKYFRKFYLAFKKRIPPILHPLGGESDPRQIGHPLGDQFQPKSEQKLLHKYGKNKSSIQITSEQSDNKRSVQEGEINGFHSNLSWSHYRVLMQVDNINARDFYESEAATCGWNRRELERQVHSLYYDRLLASQGKKEILKETRSEQKQKFNPMEMIKDPYVLEFLDLPKPAKLYESQLESAIIDNLQSFLLELGKGFAFVTRQKHIRFEEEDYFIDLVFYNYLLKCFLLIDLKIGKLTYQDIGQMDGYIRRFEEQEKVEGDNPTIGLVLCSHKNETIAKYSILAESQQIFASKYKTHLPSEEELQRELKRERDLIEEQFAEYHQSQMSATYRSFFY